MLKVTQFWRKVFRVIGLTMVLVGVLVAILCWLFWEGVQPWVGQRVSDFYREKLAKAVIRYGKNLPEVDEVRLRLLHEEPSASSNETYKAPAPAEKVYHVINRKTLTGKQAREIATLWRQLNWDENGGAACFDPHHVIEFRHQGKTICESAVCFHCGYVTLPIFLRPRLIGVVFGELKDPRNPVPDPYPLEAAFDAHLGKYIPPPSSKTSR